MGQRRKRILTWGHGGETFEYEGSVVADTTIHYGENYQWSATISAADYALLLSRFSGKDVAVGTSKTDSPPGSVGEWVKANINRSGLMSYIGAIRVDEGYATKPRPGRIRFASPSN